MTTKVAKVHSFTIGNGYGANALIPLDGKDNDRPFKAIITISQGWRWLITGNGVYAKQPDGRLTLEVEIKYLDGPSKGKSRKGVITDYDPKGCYGKIQKIK